ncbi:Periplasmic beta-glucosidase precursor [Pseudobythopirellula maris]|uniref:beta-glucosidase n=1 Tax=Pseudobythopirellula maris TaxID=2527991 RepID=A0A5C5ZVG9_9BACT|nr:glycoside hydrolase family 3 N-terminal domain-containing protein [Pseudobythopirellula maris]TWT90213.1 Periplasmic beta-glucosidase precursor [Pseudobythopirellula maris]
MIHLLCVIASILTIALSEANAQEAPPYKNPILSVDRRVADLLGRMTLEEKVAQMTCVWDEKGSFPNADGSFNSDRAREAMPHGIGQIARPSDIKGEGDVGFEPARGPRETADFVNQIQRHLIEETRLGIPAMFHEEGLHGYKARGATHFPQAIALASTWDPDLVERVNRVIGREIAVRGVRQALSPVVDVARDPRWGRIEETFGEDPYLVSMMGMAAVRGLQGDRRQNDPQPLAEGRVFATLKHMTGHGEPENGTNIGPANISERVLREAFFPPFRRAVQQADVMAVMASYNEIDGVPSHANRWLLGDILRDEWGFRGYVVGDYSAVKELETRHAVAESQAAAARLAVEAGVDIELPKPEAFPTLVDSVREGLLEEELIDRSVARLLRAKFLAGLFDDPYADPDAAERVTCNAEARELAREAADKAIVLLKNDGLLPLDPNKSQRIAVIGPNAAETLLGGYSDEPPYAVSLLEGIRQRLRGPIDAGEVSVEHAEGCRITEGRALYTHEVTPSDPAENAKRIEAAVEVARRADIVILAVGGNEHTSREGYSEKHLGDRSDLRMFGQQEALCEAVLALGKPTVITLIHGRPLAIGAIAEKTAAVLDCWYLGQETGNAIAGALFGDTNPGGKLPVSVARSVGQLPIFYNHKPTARRQYLFSSTDPLYPFGWGLSYTTFEISAPRLSSPEIGADGSITVTTEVTNKGDRPGDEVVQLYLRDEQSSVTRPVKELKRFRRVTLPPGETAEVSFTLGPDDLAFYDRDMQWTVEPGQFTLMLGANSSEVQSVGFRVTP